MSSLSNLVSPHSPIMPPPSSTSLATLTPLDDSHPPSPRWNPPWDCHPPTRNRHIILWQYVMPSGLTLCLRSCMLLSALIRRGVGLACALRGVALRQGEAKYGPPGSMGANASLSGKAATVGERHGLASGRPALDLARVGASTSLGEGEAPEGLPP
ncbi:hypothetical protein NL676_034070 [Syzygium grande]|nr:hypothetical protein NL676_034070 [Syzygium grande]